MEKMISNIIPNIMKPVLRPLYHLITHQKNLRRRLDRRIFKNETPREAILAYWSSPDDGGNLPESYVGQLDISEFLLKLIQPYASASSKILEIGCNVGRNLDYLFKAGYTKLHGIEISEKAIELLREQYPDMAAQTTIYNGAIEEVIGSLQKDDFNIVYSTAVFYHIHRDSDWIFAEIVKKIKPGGVIITVENEYATTDWRHFPRNYKKVFESTGMKQIYEINCSKVSYLKKYNENFFARVFKKP